ncbi:MAG: nitrogen fixation protein [Nitrospira sp.]
MKLDGKPKQPLCPSASLDAGDVWIIGVVMNGGTAQVQYLEKLVPPSEQVLSVLNGMRPEAVLRMAAPCAKGECHHFQGGRCSLVDRVVEHLSSNEIPLPKCPIRKDCVWFAQQGVEACTRCSQIATWNAAPSDTLLTVAKP